jgi:membrane-bound lytic murein transglycosylase D
MIFAKNILLVFLSGLLVVAAAQGQTDTLEAYHPAAITRAMPDSFSFCGERVPIEIPDVRERLEEIFYARVGSDDKIFLQLKRMPKYFPLFERILKEMDAPDDLKYLSVAESSLKIETYSNADAAGLWQFIPGTAKLWGLTVNKEIDERFNVEKSTRAAVRMLKSLREAYGSWSLAAAAYNTGQANINKVLKDQGENDYFNLFLNRETRNYVFQIVVMKEILQHPKKYGYALGSNDVYKPYDAGTQKITLKGPIANLAQWAKDHGTNYKTVRWLNFWIMKYVLPEGSWEIRLPADSKVGDWKSDSLSSVSPKISADTSSLVTKIFYTVKPGDNLSRIAELYKVSVPQLRQWNELAGDALRADSQLIIFVNAK